MSTETPIQDFLSPLGIWQWTNPSPVETNTSPAPGVEAEVAWKEEYAVAGTLQSFDQVEPLTAELSLMQIGPWTTSPLGAGSSLVATQSVSIAPGASVPIAFGLFSQSWKWFEQETGVLTDVTEKFVTYSISIVFTASDGNETSRRSSDSLSHPVDDESGDESDPRRSRPKEGPLLDGTKLLTITAPDLIVHVSVSASKTNDQYLAQESFAASVALAIAAAASGIWTFGIGVVALGAAAFAAQALAQGEADAAEDPPDPSLAFHRIERPDPKVLTAPSDSETQSIRELLARGLRVTEAKRVLSITEGRLEGARRVGTQDDINRQLDHYTQVVAMAKADRQNVRDVGTEADREFAKVLENLSHAIKGQADKPQHRDSSVTQIRGVNPHVLRALRVLQEHPAVAAEVCIDTLGNVRSESEGVFDRLANGILEAIAHVVGDGERLVRAG